ncbi:pyrroline-5-carboxylate reductase [Glutamicibacter sp. PS]|uniref:pyrroline-5-carboxylate reductase n=1 Tax=Glutamicibacter sp. PS TaxID=3075634 RepID=UPI002848ED1F|nr:pyrroline-5-carboxylate reductase [Glutamicibacter sp. PS]MDR4532084.1 pyrroline-5-carboxylate reductase [Glutamicibacter sp. PS]
MSDATQNLKLAFLGAGSMNGAILRGILGAGHDPQNITATVRSETRRQELEELGVNVVVTGENPEHNARVAAESDVVFLGVKPVGITALCQDISAALRPETVVVSVAAAITLATMAANLPGGQPLVRSMPNTPLMVGAGVVGLSPAETASKQQVSIVYDLFASSGDVHVVPESQIDALSAISGSGPAYAFYLAEAMANAGIELGLDEKLAKDLARATVAGAGKMLADPSVDAAQLRRNVTSPKGTTEQAILAFDEGGIPAIIATGAKAATARAAQLSRELG